MTALSPVLTTKPTTGLALGTHNYLGQPAPTSTTVMTEQRILTPVTFQNTQLSCRAFGLGMSRDGSRRGPRSNLTFVVTPPAIGGLASLAPADAIGAAVGKDLD